MGREISSRPHFVFFKKALYDVKAKWFAAWFPYITTALILVYIKNKPYKSLDY